MERVPRDAMARNGVQRATFRALSIATLLLGLVTKTMVPVRVNQDFGECNARAIAVPTATTDFVNKTMEPATMAAS